MKGIILLLLLGAFIGLGISLIFKKKGIYLGLISFLSAFLFYKFRFVAGSIFLMRTTLAIILFIYCLTVDTSKLKMHPGFLKIMLLLLLIINFFIYKLTNCLLLIISSVSFYIIFFILKSLAKRIVKIEVLGHLDLLIITFTGLYLGFLPGLKALLLSLLLALPLSIYMLKTKKNSRISYAPFIMLGLLLVAYYG